MAFNHDKKYEHFTQKEFTPGKNSGGEFSNKGEASPPARGIDWKQMKGLEKPWEDCDDPMDTYVADDGDEDDKSDKKEKE